VKKKVKGEPKEERGCRIRELARKRREGGETE